MRFRSAWWISRVLDCDVLPRYLPSAYEPWTGCTIDWCGHNGRRAQIAGIDSPHSRRSRALFTLNQRFLLYGWLISLKLPTLRHRRWLLIQSPHQPSYLVIWKLQALTNHGPAMVKSLVLPFLVFTIGRRKFPKDMLSRSVAGSQGLSRA